MDDDTRIDEAYRAPRDQLDSDDVPGITAELVEQLPLPQAALVSDGAIDLAEADEDDEAPDDRRIAGRDRARRGKGPRPVACR